MDNKIANIIVCCGGTGSKIAANLAELMGQDPSSRYTMDTSTYFVLIDTDAGDLKKYGDRIRKAAPDIHVETILTTGGFNLPGEMLAEFMRPIEEETDSLAQQAGLKRFAEHWWCANVDGKNMFEMNVFGVPGIKKSIQEGAGQVPMVSFLATWLAMRPNSRNSVGIEETLRKLAREIYMRTGGATQFNAYLLGSLAGGTGRGSLLPIAFKIKEIFYQDFQTSPAIDAYLLHSSCFHFDERDKRIATMVNAMTGWSEISTWLDKPEPKCSSFYSLPSVKAMHDPKLDLLVTSSGDVAWEQEKKKRLSYPIDQLYVIGPTNQNGYTVNVKSGDEIYSMIGASLYVKLTQSVIASDVSNSSRDFASVGSSIAEIPSHDLDNFFQLKARADALAALLSVGSIEQNQKKKDDDICTREVNQLFQKLGIVDAWSQVSSNYVPVERETPVDRFILDHVVPRLNQSWSQLLQLMRDQDTKDEIEELLTQISRQFAYTDPDFQREVSSGYERSLIEHFRVTKNENYENSNALAKNLLNDMVDNLMPLGERSQTAFNSGALQKIRVSMDSLVAESEKSRESAQLLPTPQTGLKDELGRISGREGFLGMIGAYYSKAEIDGFEVLLKKHLRYNFARALAEGLSASNGLIAELKSNIEILGARCKTCETALKKLSAKDQYKQSTIKESQDRLFSTNISLESSLGMNNMVGLAHQNVRRTIRPPHPHNDDLKLQSEKIRNVLINILDPSVKQSTSDLDVEVLEAEFERALFASKYEIRRIRTDEVSGSVREAWVESRGAFSMSETLQELGVMWKSYLADQCAISNDRRMELLQKFNFFFGTTPLVSDGDVRMLSDDLSSIAPEDGLLLSLAAATLRSCAAFWSVDDPEKRKYVVLIPKDMRVHHHNWVSYLQKQVGDGVSIDIVKVANEFNPCLLAVYTENSVKSWEQIRTLTDWRDDPMVAQVLALSETASPSHPFNPEIKRVWPDYRGSGFTEPRYVLKPECRISRWRPWLSTIDIQKESAAFNMQVSNGALTQAREILPLLYGIFGSEAFICWALGQDRGQATIASIEALTDGKARDAFFVEGKNRQWSVARYAVVFKENRISTIRDQGFTPQSGRLQSGVANLKLMLGGEIEALSGEMGKRLEMAQKLNQALIDEYESFETVVAANHGFSTNDHRQYQLMLQGLKKAIQQKHDTADKAGKKDDVSFWHEVDRHVEQLLSE